MKPVPVPMQISSNKFFNQSFDVGSSQTERETLRQETKRERKENKDGGKGEVRGINE